MASDELRREWINHARAALVSNGRLSARPGGEAQRYARIAVDAVLPLIQEGTAERLRAELTAKLGLCCEPCQENRHADCTGYCQGSCCAAWDDAVRDTAERIAAWLGQWTFSYEPGDPLADAVRSIRSGAWKEQP